MVRKHDFAEENDKYSVASNARACLHILHESGEFIFYSVRHTLYVIQCTSYTVCHTLYVIHYMSYTICHTLYGIYCMSYTVCHTLYVIHYMSYIVRYILYVIHCTSYNVCHTLSGTQCMTPTYNIRHSALCTVYNI